MIIGIRAVEYARIGVRRRSIDLRPSDRARSTRLLPPCRNKAHAPRLCSRAIARAGRVSAGDCRHSGRPCPLRRHVGGILGTGRIFRLSAAPPDATFHPQDPQRCRPVAAAKGSRMDLPRCLTNYYELLLLCHRLAQSANYLPAPFDRGPVADRGVGRPLPDRLDHDPVVGHAIGGNRQRHISTPRRVAPF